MIDHLLKRGSGHLDWVEPSHPLALGWVLLGALVVPIGLLGLLAGRRRPALRGVIAVYAVSAAALLVWVWPVLQ